MEESDWATNDILSDSKPESGGFPAGPFLSFLELPKKFLSDRVTRDFRQCLACYKKNDFVLLSLGSSSRPVF